jgi:VCBS repeat-containing protein
MAWTIGNWNARAFQTEISLSANGIGGSKGPTNAFDAVSRVDSGAIEFAGADAARSLSGHTGGMSQSAIASKLTALGAQTDAGGAGGGFTASFGLGGSSAMLSGANLQAAGLSAAAGAAMSAKLQMGLTDLFVASKINGISALDGKAAFDAMKAITGSNTLLQMYVEGADSHGRGGDLMVAVDFVASNGDGAGLLSQLEAMGLMHGGAYGAMAGGYIAIDKLDDVSAMKALAFARPVYATTDVGLTESQDVQSMNVDFMQDDFGFDGTGLTIGVISDSFATRAAPLTTHAQDVTNGDLPAGITIIKDKPAPAGTDEGRGMAQQAYDIAPGAQFKFYTAFVSMADFAVGIDALADAGCQIIVDDVRYFAEPMFQDGIVAQAVDAAVADGAMYFSSAGNSANNSYMSTFVDSGTTVVNGGFTYKMMDFDPGAGVDARLRVNQTGTTVYDLQWAEPFKSVSPGSTGATSDVALFFFQTNGTLIAKIDTLNIGADPIELAQLTGAGLLDIAIGVKSTSANPTLVKLDAFSSTFSFQEFDTQSATAWGHNNAAGAIALAASDWVDSDRFGDFPIPSQPFPYAEAFTSKGGQQILFDLAGNLLASPEFRDNVKFTASDGGNTTFFGTDVSYDADTFPNFYGTSSAAPNAAAMAAILMQAFPSATPAEIEQALADSAIDILVDYNNNPTGVGTDLTTGTGLIQMDGALAELHALFAPTANDDAVSTDEATALSGGDVFADNGSGADTDPNNILFVTEVNGSSSDVGTQIVLASGALLTLNEDGTFDYDPDGAFDHLPGASSGASNLTATDTFTYTLHGGGTATVTVTVNGVDSDDTLLDTSGNDSLDGGIGNDDIYMTEGGDDTALGGIGNDTFRPGDQFTAADSITGGDGDDRLMLNGDYSAGVVFAASTMSGVERIRLIAGSDYNLTIHDGNTAAGDSLVVFGKSLDVGDDLTFDGSAELDAKLRINGGDGDDSLTGGGRQDRINGGGGDDSLTGGSGKDVFTFAAVDADGDTLVDFNGNGAGNGDTLVFTGYGNGTITQFDADTWEVVSEDLSIHDFIDFTNAASVDASDYTFI